MFGFYYNHTYTFATLSGMKALIQRSRVKRAKICQRISSTWRNFACLPQFIQALTKMQTLISLPFFVTSQTRRWCICQTLQCSCRQCNEHTTIEQAVNKAQCTNPTELMKFNDIYWSAQPFNHFTVFMFRHRSVLSQAIHSFRSCVQASYMLKLFPVIFRQY